MVVATPSLVRRPPKLPAGVTSLDTFIFTVPHNSIEIMDLPEDSPGKDCKPINVRNLSAKNNQPMSGRGFSIEEMAELRESIRDAGWFGLFLCRWYRREDGSVGVQLVAGERRFRCILKLIEENTLCRDRTKDEYDNEGNVVKEGWTTAQELYSTVRCEVLELSDEEAQMLNFLENDKHAAVGEGATIAIVRRMRAWGWDDAKILKKVHKSKQWLFETDQLCDLDSVCFQAICEDKVNRTGGLLLTKIDDATERQEVLHVAVTGAWDRARNLIEKRKGQLSKAEHQEDVAVAKLTVAECQGGEDGTIDKLRERAETAGVRTDKRREAFFDAQKEATAKQRDVRYGIRTVRPRSARTSGNPALRPAKIQKFYADTIERLITAEGKDAAGSKVAHEEHLYVARTIVQGILTGKTDAEALFRKHYKPENDQAAPAA